MSKVFYLNSRLYCLLFLSVIFLCSCKKQERQNHIVSSILENEYQESLSDKDSIIISVRFKSKGSTGFNIKDNYHHYYYLNFSNIKDTNKVVTKKIDIIFDNQIINFGGGRFVDGKIEYYEHNFLLSKKSKDLRFDYVDGNVELKNTSDVYIIDSLHNDYNRIGLKIDNFKESDKQILNQELHKVYKYYEEKYSNVDNSLLKNLNKQCFIDKLQRLHPMNEDVDEYLKGVKKPIVSNYFSNIQFFYIKNRIDTFNFNELNIKNYSKDYINFLSIGIFNFLRNEDNKGDKKYQPAIDWLKTTDLYKNDSIYVKKEIIPINNEIFKKKLKDLSLTGVKNINTDLKQITKENPSSYYLLDFWATWCGPCVQGVKLMKEMELPKNVKVISISVDKEKDKQKWVKMTNKLQQSITYWLDETNYKTKEFVKFIEMQSVPRYILIDKNMNLIDQAFYHPKEPHFLPKLKDVKNHKYW